SRLWAGRSAFPLRRVHHAGSITHVPWRSTFPESESVKQPVASRAIGAKRTRKGGRGKREQERCNRLHACGYPATLLREEYIFLQGKGIVKPCHALWNQRVLVEPRITKWVGMV